MAASDKDRIAAKHFLEIALADAQATVRAYDTKAQIVGIGYTFALNIVASAGGGFPTVATSPVIPVLIFWGIIMAPIFLFGYVLYPSRKTAPKIEGASALGLGRVLYVETARFKTVEALEDAALGCDWVRELSFEIMKVSKLREMKRGRFIRALFVTAVSFACLFTLQLWTLT